jgi:hypothetical protein
MTDRPAALERAFDLARSGEFANVSEVRERLAAAGFSGRQVEGPLLARQLLGCVTQPEAGSL